MKCINSLPSGVYSGQNRCGECHNYTGVLVVITVLQNIISCVSSVWKYIVPEVFAEREKIIC